jgi:molybdopterin synthase catalytic subunit
VAFFPPVSGGMGLVRVQREDFSVDAVVRATRTEGAGAVCTFTGVVRADARGGEPVERLEYEAYAEMAQQELERLAALAVEKFDLTDCSIVHRHGTLRVGEQVCLVVTASRHRRAAYEANAWVMEELKRVVPLWKKERTATGERWL